MPSDFPAPLSPSPPAASPPAVSPTASPAIGVLMLDTRFPRPPGDIGNPASWPGPVAFARIAGASVPRAVRAGAPDPALLAPFIAEARHLAANGARLIATSCGFLSPFQADLARACPVPLVSSALLLVGLLQAGMPPGRRVGVLTVSAERLGPAHLAGAGAPADTPLAGLPPDASLARTLLEDRERLDPAAAEAEVRQAGRALRAAHPEVAAIVLECTNLPPYAAALRRDLGLPVYGIVDLCLWLLRLLGPGAPDGIQDPAAP